MTGGDVRRLWEMPDNAQRRISQMLLVLQAAQYERDAVKPELGRVAHSASQTTGPSATRSLMRRGPALSRGRRRTVDHTRSG
jgi:hypothetical protein